jgi:hypothetical protein
MGGNSRNERWTKRKDTEMDLMHMFLNGVGINLYSDVTVVDVQHTLTHETCFLCAQNVL